MHRYEYAAPAAVLSEEGTAGFVMTCAFKREKSATMEALQLIGDHLPTPGDSAPRGLRLNPVKLPGRGFVFVRLSPRPSRSDGDDPASTVSTTQTTAASSVVLGVSSAVVAAVRSGTAKQPRWLEKLQPVHTTCTADPAAVAAAVHRSLTHAGVDVTGGVTFAVVYRNRFKGESGAGTGAGRGDKKEKEDDEYSRGVVVPRVAAGVEAAATRGGSGRDDVAGAATVVPPRVDLKDPGVVIMVEVVSVPTPNSVEGDGRYSRRLAVGVLPKTANVFEVKGRGIAPCALKATTGGAIAAGQGSERKKDAHRGRAQARDEARTDA